MNFDAFETEIFANPCKSFYHTCSMIDKYPDYKLRLNKLIKKLKDRITVLKISKCNERNDDIQHITKLLNTLAM